MQELIKIKENSFCVIRALSGKSTYIRLYFHFLNAEVITCSATLNIFSSCLLNCIASAWSQLILPRRQPGGEAHLHPQRYWRHLWQQQGHRMFTLVHVLKTKSGFGVITNNCSCGYALQLQNYTAHFSLCLSPDSSVRLLQNTEESLWGCPVFFPSPCRATLQKLAMSPRQCPVSTNSLQQSKTYFDSHLNLNSSNCC